MRGDPATRQTTASSIRLSSLDSLPPFFQQKVGVPPLLGLLPGPILIVVVAAMDFRIDDSLEDGVLGGVDAQHDHVHGGGDVHGVLESMRI